MSDIDQLIARIASLPEGAQKELTAATMAATKDLRFIPQPGPQTRAYLSEADVLLFGGSPGGGKTALEVGLALNAHHRSMIVRKNFTDLDGVLHTLDNILGQEGSAVGGNRPKYRKPGGGIIDFMGLGDDIDGKQGNPHDLICVGKETPVLMADGSFRAACTVRKGDMVATLEGPRRVVNAFPTPKKQAVRVSTPYGSQVQSAAHKLLTTRGWKSWEAYAVSPPCEISAPKGFRAARRFCGLFAQKSQQVWRFLAHRIGGSTPSHGSLKADPSKGPTDLSASGVYTGPPARGNGCGGCGDRPQLMPQLLLSFGWIPKLTSRQMPTGAATGTSRRCASSCGATCELKTSLSPSCQESYSAGSRLYGGHTLELSDQGFGLEDDQPSPLLLACAGLRNPSGSPGGGEGTARTHTLRGWWYAHPYTTVRRRSTSSVHFSACEISPVEDTELFDLEVEEVNHFITLGGFVNKNCIDEAAQVPEQMVRMLIGWLRTDKPGQRCRVVLGSNPPLNTTGDWLIEYFAPWLDPRHPNPAEEGELRYFLPSESGMGDREVAKDEFIEMNGVRVPPQSRTFISSKFTDNAYYDPEQYAKSLSGLPDSARDRLISGNFLMDRADDVWQTIPTAWVKAAQARWSAAPPRGVPMCAMGMDVAQGGSDNTVLAIRHDGWYAPLIVEPGKSTPDGKAAGGFAIKYRRDRAKVIVDLGGGWGGDAYGHLKENGIDCVGYMGVKASTRRTSDKQLKFFNVRTEAYWRFREALDPSQPGGSPIMLPPDSVLVADLCAPSYEIGPNGIKVEAKDDVVKRLKRSPDRGDAVVMAWWDGLKQANVPGGFGAALGRPPQVVTRRPR